MSVLTAPPKCLCTHKHTLIHSSFSLTHSYTPHSLSHTQTHTQTHSQKHILTHTEQHILYCAPHTHTNTYQHPRPHTHTHKHIWLPHVWLCGCGADGQETAPPDTATKSRFS